MPCFRLRQVSPYPSLFILEVPVRISIELSAIPILAAHGFFVAFGEQVHGFFVAFGEQVHGFFIAFGEQAKVVVAITTAAG